MAKRKIILDQTRDENGKFRTGCRITEGTKYITCAYLTNWQGQRCCYYRTPKEDFTTPQQMLRDIVGRRIPPYKTTKPITL